MIDTASMPAELRAIVHQLETLDTAQIVPAAVHRCVRRMLAAAECDFPALDPKQTNLPAVAQPHDVVVLLDGGVVAHEDLPDGVRLSVVHVDLLTDGDDSEAKEHWEGASEAAREAVRELFPRASERFE